MTEPTDKSASSSPVANTAAEAESSSEPSPASPATPIRTEVTPPQSTSSIDVISKTLALAVVFLYLSGFLITSLHNFRYGFSEMNPLRPRILAAGGWFALFTLVPLGLVRELRTGQARFRDPSYYLLQGNASLFAAYMASSGLLVSVADGLFAYESNPVTTHIKGLMVIAWGGGSLILYLALGYFKVDVRYSRVSVTVLLFGYYAVYFIVGVREVIRSEFSLSSVNLWIFLLGALFYFELSQHDWKFSLHGWQRMIAEMFVILTLFATVYYPHIMAKWGGGALIPVAITFTKDTPSPPIQCSLIDETDAGFYILRKDDTFATFLPRAEISSIYYGKVTGVPPLASTGPSGSPSNLAPGTPAPPSQQQGSNTGKQTGPKP